MVTAPVLPQAFGRNHLWSVILLFGMEYSPLIVNAKPTQVSTGLRAARVARRSREYPRIWVFYTGSVDARPTRSGPVTVRVATELTRRGADAVGCGVYPVQMPRAVELRYATYGRKCGSFTNCLVVCCQEVKHISYRWRQFAPHNAYKAVCDEAVWQKRPVNLMVPFNRCSLLGPLFSIAATF
jgi:hypothetical protein